MEQSTKEIIKNIAEIQLEALKVIEKNPEGVDHTLLCKLLQVTDEEIRDAIDHHIQLYQDIRDTPQLVGMLNEYQLSICQHILFRMEADWILSNSDGVYGAWAILWEADKKFHPEINLIL